MKVSVTCSAMTLFHDMTLKNCPGVECDPSESRIIVVGPHMSIWEGIAHGHGNALCSSVSGAQVTKWFMVGEFFKAGLLASLGSKDVYSS